mgnify:CR=1 FL=1
MQVLVPTNVTYVISEPATSHFTARLRMLAFEEADECNDNKRKATKCECHGDKNFASNNSERNNI